MPSDYDNPISKKGESDLKFCHFRWVPLKSFWPWSMLRADGAKLILIELKIEQRGPEVYFPILEFHPDDVDANDMRLRTLYGKNKLSKY